MVQQEGGDVVADAAGADDRDPGAGRGAAGEQVVVADHDRQLDAGDVGAARAHAAGDDDLVEAFVPQQGGIGAGTRAQFAAGGEQAGDVGGGDPRVVLLAGDARGQQELATGFVLLLEQHHRMAALGGGQRCREAGRAGADHRHALASGRDGRGEFQLAPGRGIDHAAHCLAGEVVVEAGLVAGDARHQTHFVALARMTDEAGVGEEGAGQHRQAAVAARQHRLGELRVVDAVGHRQRNRQRPGEAAGSFRKQRVGHALLHGRHRRLVPADASGQHVGAGGGDGLRHRHGFVPVQAAVHQVEQRMAVHQQARRPQRLAHRTHHLDCEADAVGQRPAPVVMALVGAGCRELAQQVAL